MMGRPEYRLRVLADFFFAHRKTAEQTVKSLPTDLQRFSPILFIKKKQITTNSHKFF